MAREKEYKKQLVKCFLNVIYLEHLEVLHCNFFFIDLNDVASDNDDDKDDDDDDDANSKDAEVVEIRTGEALTVLDRLVNLKYLSKQERNSLIAMKDKLVKIRVLTKKQSHIKD